MGETRGETPTITSLGARRGAGGSNQSPEVWWKWEWPSVSVIHIFSVKIEPDKLVSLEPLLEEDAFWQFLPHLAASLDPCHSNSTLCEEKGWKCEVEFPLILVFTFLTNENPFFWLWYRAPLGNLIATLDYLWSIHPNHLQISFGSVPASFIKNCLAKKLFLHQPIFVSQKWDR